MIIIIPKSDHSNSSINGDMGHDMIGCGNAQKQYRKRLDMHKYGYSSKL